MDEKERAAKRYGIWRDDHSYMVMHYTPGWTVEDKSKAAEGLQLVAPDLTRDEVFMWLSMIGVKHYASVIRVEDANGA